jgi:hypothetical protein
MFGINEFARDGLPLAIPAENLQQLIGPSATFCSFEALHPSARPCGLLVPHWPFLCSEPLLGPHADAAAAFLIKKK